jgi:hypothetical protein
MWLYNGKEIGEEDLEGNVAFVYLITNLTNNKRYIGKKLLAFTRTKKVKGQTRRKRVKTESDWKEYFGSNKRLLDDVTQLGPENFKREILKLCKTKGTANYYEAYEIMVRHAIIDPEYYNEWLHVKVSQSQVKP